MGEVIIRIDGLQAIIVTAVQVQLGTASEVVRNVTEISISGREIDTMISSIAAGARGMTCSAVTTADTARQVRRGAWDLNRLMGRLRT